MINAHEYANQNGLIDLGQMTAAGQNTEPINLRKLDGKSVYNGFTFQVRVSGITTNVLLQVVGNLDGDPDGWANLTDDGEDIYIAADGTYLLHFHNFGECDYVRLEWVSESGGTAAVIDVKCRVMQALYLERTAVE